MVDGKFAEACQVFLAGAKSLNATQLWMVSHGLK
jgi:hypothetical protein